MGKIIHVPQGRGARLTKATLSYDIDGLLGDSLRNIAMPIGVQLEGFLNNFDAIKLLKRNLKQVLDENDENSIFSY